MRYLIEEIHPFQVLVCDVEYLNNIIATTFNSIQTPNLAVMCLETLEYSDDLVFTLSQQVQSLVLSLHRLQVQVFFQLHIKLQ